MAQTLRKVNQELTAQEAEFVRAYARSGDIVESAKLAGFDAATARTMMQRYNITQSLVVQMRHAIMSELAPLAISNALQGLQTGKIPRDMVRLIALVFDISNIKVDNEKAPDANLQEMTRDQLLSFVAGIKAELDARTIDITPGAPGAPSAASYPIDMLE